MRAARAHDHPRHYRPCTVAAPAVVVALAGCLSVPEGTAPMCHADNDCATSVEVCQEGVCWGNPPARRFAAIVSPPGTRRDLVSRELPQVSISDAGWISDLALEAPVTLAGRVTAFCGPPMIGCDANAPLAATITLSRRSQFQGGPGFKTVVNVDAAADSFSIPVPRTRSGDDEDMYTITVVPSGVQPPGGGHAPAELVPPLRTTMALPDTTPIKTVKIVLGGANLPQITGLLTNSLGEGLRGYRVSALGRWDPTEPATEVSSVATTDASGAYSITLSEHLSDPVELIARPPADPANEVAATAASVHRTNIDAQRSSTHSIAVPANLGNPVELVVQVSGADLSGEISPVPGAVVTVSGGVAPVVTSDSFTVTAQQVTDKMGNVTLRLLDGPSMVASYRLSIVPPASSTLGVVFDQTVSLAPGVRTILPRRLASRFTLSGQIVDSNGQPLKNVAVTARPSLRFLWALDAGPQAFVAAIPAATDVTTDKGGFVLWIDPGVAQNGATYDLVIEPQAQGQAPVLAPTYVKTGVMIPSNEPLNKTTVEPIVLPEAAYVHGQVIGPGGPVDNAELKLYQLSDTLDSVCSEVAHAPASCPIPAQIQARNTSDAAGFVRLTLAR
jgi:hypothetical protein